MIFPKTELRFISKEIGYGVVATDFIPKGTITWVLDSLDREFTPSQLIKMPPVYREILDTYSYRNNRGNYVLCWDFGRYVNHSFKSNCITTAYDFEIAIRDIHPGEQLTDDYGYLNIDEPFEAVDEGTERKVVYPDDLLKYHSVWDAQLKEIFHLIPTLPQPLKKFMSDKQWKNVEKISSGKKEMKSILTCYFSGKQEK
ncbi:MAG TPA: SET domain-containing protein [Flavobacteriaceae bacterium]|nr:SET domain-containing protein [Flavobacteriaceae bacterium]